MAEVEVTLPTLHEGQIAAFNAYLENQFLAVRAGRRWGKTDFAKTIACDVAMAGDPVGWFAPDYKIQSEAYNEIVDILEPAKKRSSKTEGAIRVKTGGRLDFWTLDNERAGRSRKYKLVIIDEAAFTANNMMTIWEQSIKPTLLDLGGSCVVLSNTNGIDPENFLWRICNQSEHGFKDFHAPTSGNPLLPLRLPGESEELHAARRLKVLEKLKTDNHPLVYKQEYLADFVDFSGEAFFSVDKLLLSGNPVDYPVNCDAVFAIIDSATKTGKANDGTGCAYYAVNKANVSAPLVALDWSLIQIEGDLLITWLPSVLQRLEELAKVCGARGGSVGAFIEDKDSGQILLQAAQRKGMPATAIPSTLTSIGKDERAIKASSHVYTGKCKLSQFAYDKVEAFKGVTRNHYLSQIVGFRVGDKDAAKRADDLLDCFTYGVLVALGDSDGL